jgi:cobalamin-dependent methionine synthase I
MMAFLNRMLAREGRKTTKHRYSPGYGDLSLRHQKIIFDLLDLQRLDLTITPDYILIPEKSVVAIAGIETLT